MESLTYRLPGLLQSDDAALLESSSSSFDVAIEPVVVCASPPVGDSAVSVFGLNSVVGWPCALWWWWWWVLALLPPLLLPLIIVAVGHDVNVLCVSVMGSIWKHSKFEAKKGSARTEGERKRVGKREGKKRNIKLSAWSEKINNATTRKSWKNKSEKSTAAAKQKQWEFKTAAFNFCYWFAGDFTVFFIHIPFFYAKHFLIVNENTARHNGK